jgi:hypothetical protein
MIKLSISLLSILFSSSLMAAVPADPTAMLSARAQGRGSSVMNFDENIDGLLMNPSALAFQEQYALSLGLSGMGGGLSVAVVDTKSGPLGGGLYYNRRDLQSSIANESLLLGDYSRLEDEVGAALFTKLSNRFSFGIKGKYLYQSNSELAELNGKAFSGGVSATVKASDSIQFGFGAHNLVDTKLGAYPKSYFFGASYFAGSGVSLSGQYMSFEESAGTNFSLPGSGTSSFSLGGEYRFKEFRFRAGYMDNSAWDESIVSAGLGYFDKHFSVDYAFQNLSNSGLQYHSFSITGYL